MLVRFGFWAYSWGGLGVGFRALGPPGWAFWAWSVLQLSAAPGF